MIIICNLKHRHAIYLKFGEKFSTSLTKSVLKGKASICSTIKKNLLLYYRTFSEFVVVVIFNILLQPLAIETINFTTESLAFQDRHLNGAHSISDLKLPWYTPENMVFHE